MYNAWMWTLFHLGRTHGRGGNPLWHVWTCPVHLPTPKDFPGRLCWPKGSLGTPVQQDSSALSPGLKFTSAVTQCGKLIMDWLKEPWERVGQSQQCSVTHLSQNSLCYRVWQKGHCSRSLNIWLSHMLPDNWTKLNSDKQFFFSFWDLEGRNVVNKASYQFIQLFCAAMLETEGWTGYRSSSEGNPAL